MISSGMPPLDRCYLICLLNVYSIAVFIEVIPPLFESNSNFIGINFSVGNTTATGWRLVYQINEIKPQPLLVIDSATTTLFLAVLAVLGFLFSGIIPP